MRADSLHAADRFSLTLDKGNYQWSLQAFNGIYRSEESVYSLRVDPAAADESQSLSDPQEPAEEGDDMQEAFAVPGREGLSGSDGLAMPNPSTESAGASGLSVRTVRRTDSSPAVAGMGCFRSRIARHGRLFQVSRSGRPKDDCRRRATAGCGLPVRHGHSAPICYRRKNAFQVTKLFPSHEIPSADIPVTRRSARYLGRRGMEALFSGPKPAASDPAAVPVARNNPRADIDTLRLDYPDPFLRAVATRPSVPGSVSARAPVRSKAKNERPSAKLACTGRIRKEGTDRYLISIDGRNHLLRQGESAGGFRLHAVGADSLWLAADGRKYGLKIP